MRDATRAWSALTSCVGLVLGACSCGTAPAPAPAATATTATEASGTGGASTAAASASPAAYDVHEWGLMRALPGDVLSAGAIGPPRPVMALSVDKPVLYFHADGSLTLRTVELDAGGGAIVEVWPDPLLRTAEASRLTWRDVALEPTGECAPSPLPTLGDPPCALLPAGEMCEVASLGIVRVPGVACVRTAGVVDSLLFYRARTRAFTPPLRFERSAAVYAEVTITNDGTLPIPGWIVRLHDSYGSVRALAVRPPAPGTSIVVGADFAAAAADGTRADDEAVADMPVAPGSPEPGRRAVRESMREIGLTDGEVDAFLRAWDERLFGLTPTGVDRTVLDTLAADDLRTTDEDGELAPAESFLYFLPEPSVDGVARLTFDPPPRSVRRAMAVWSALRAVGSSH
jgi:hypothetical protein